MAPPSADETEHNAAVQARFAAHRDEVLDEAESSIPKNTKKAYSAPLKSWSEWCAKLNWEGEIVSEEKLLSWLKEEVITKKVMKRKGGKKRKRTRAAAAAAEAEEERQGLSPEDDAAALTPEFYRSMGVDPDNPQEVQEFLDNDRVDLNGRDAAVPEEEILEEADIKYTTLQGYVNAVVNLYDKQRSRKTNPHPHPRGHHVKQFMKQESGKKDQKARENFEDRGEGGIAAGYTDEQYERLNWRLIKEAVLAPAKALRTRLDILLGHNYLFRGENRRGVELSDLAPLVLSKSEGPSECKAAVVTVSNGKINRFGRKQFMGAIRHRNPFLCVLNSLALYFFWRWHISGEQAPRFENKQSWYRIKVLVAGGNDLEKPISYTTQYTAVLWAFQLCSIITVMITHVMRACGALMAERHGVSNAQIAKGGRWDNSNMVNAYLTQLPLKLMRRLAGFQTKEGAYYIPRANIEPPPELAALVFPFVEEWEIRFEARGRGKKAAQGGLDEKDTAGDAFLALLKILRVVLLQDLAVMQPEFPDLPHFKQAFAEHEAWLPFAEAVRESHNTATSHRNAELDAIAPQISNAIYEAQVDTGSRITACHDVTVNMLQQITKALQFVSSQFPLAITIGHPMPILPVLEELWKPAIQPNIDPILNVPAQQTQTPHTPISITSEVPEQIQQQFQPQTTQQLDSRPIPLLAPHNRPNLGRTVAPEALANQEKPQMYEMQDVKTIADLWKEYYHGYGGGPSIESLEKRWKTAWRPCQRKKTQFSRNKTILDEVRGCIEQGMTVQTAISKVEQVRNGRSMYKFYLAITAAKKAKRVRV